MKNALILHGTGGNAQENWFQWLETELRHNGYKVWTPNLPHADTPNIDTYNQYIFPRWQFDSDSIIVGHSSGAVAILGILENLPDDIVINTAYLVAGFTDDLGWKELEKMFLKPFDWTKIKNKAKKFILYHSDDDPYVGLKYGKELKDKLGAELIILPGYGHFNLQKGPQFKQFPELLEKILE